MNKFGGIYPALITPYRDDGKIDFDILQNLIEYTLAHGAEGYFICGTTGEFLYLRQDEKKEIIKTCLNQIGTRAETVVQIGGGNMKDSFELAEYALSFGADAVSSIHPIYYQYNDEQIINYYKTIMDRIDAPFIVYDIPCYTNKELISDKLKEIYTHKNCCGIKASIKDMALIEKFKRTYPEKTLFIGSDGCVLSALAVGADGAVGSTYNLIPQMFRRLIEEYRAGKIEIALEMQHDINAMLDVFGKINDIAGLKYALKNVGFNCPTTRNGIVRLTSSDKKEIDEAFAVLNKKYALI